MITSDSRARWYGAIVNLTMALTPRIRFFESFHVAPAEERQGPRHIHPAIRDSALVKRDTLRLLHRSFDQRALLSAIGNVLQASIKVTPS